MGFRIEIVTGAGTELVKYIKDTKLARQTFDELIESYDQHYEDEIAEFRQLPQRQDVVVDVKEKFWWQGTFREYYRTKAEQFLLVNVMIHGMICGHLLV